MKATSMWQPWASLWLTNAKQHETRGRRFNYRGWLAVQAAKREPSAPVDTSPQLEEICVRLFGPYWRATLPRGVVIGAVHVRACYSAKPEAAASQDDLVCGFWHDSRFAIHRDYVIKLPQPMPVSGMQSITFEIPEEIKSAIQAEIKLKGFSLQ